MKTGLLQHLEFELAYLSLLTAQGLKPLSRWEKDFDRATEEVLQELGLKTRVVERSVQSGRRLRELIFSSSEQCLGLYAGRFDGTAIDRTRATIRFEGRLFGYPTCCIESFIARGYARNSLRRRDQRILFHWACPQCSLTPLLLPHYWRIYRQCRASRRRGSAGRPALLGPEVPRQLKRAVALVASLAALATPLAGHTPAAVTPNPHWLPLPASDDPDGDFLATSEEVILGMDPADPDENHNLQPDGPDLALSLSTMIDALPTVPSATQPYVIHHMAFGLENCQACGAVTNMGSLEIVNPLENQSFAMPYVAKHFLENGSFSYAGTNFSGILHSGRLNSALLKTALTSSGLAHFIAEPKDIDADTDGLRQWEEAALGTDPAKTDTDGDHLIDGVDVIRAMRSQLDTLPRTPQPDRPYVLDHPMDGIETCPRCGERVVMDLWEVINPVSGDSLTIPSMALHYMEHGGCGWEGGQLLGGKGRVDPRQLQAALTGKPNQHLLSVTPDADRDWLADQEEQDLGKDPQNPDEDRNGVPDGLDLARATMCEIAALPTGPVVAVFRLDFPLRGVERCDICGTNVNMGHLTVCNPFAQLYAKLPYIAVHYLEHDAFSFAGDVHGRGRTDVKLLLDALHSTGPSHMLRVAGDTDSDGLKDPEELRLGTDPNRADTDQDGVPDGFALAHQMWAEVEALPRLASPGVPPTDGHCYAVDHPLRGVVPCQVCGSTVNMGWVDVINPKEQLSLSVSYLALHFMRYGSFAWTAADRVNPRLLDVALHGDGSSHLVLWPGDSDRDGLLDAEETHFGTRPDVPDTSGNGLLDGVELARRLHQSLKTLPLGPHPSGKYRLSFEADCVAPCSVCGENVNCGHEVITNAWAGFSAQISYMNLHYLEHGSLAASATERVDPILLDTLLQPTVTIAAAENGLTLRWMGKLGRDYQLFTSDDVSGSWTPGPTFKGNGGELVFTDAGAAGKTRKFYQIRMW
jgi:hypothetical protein